jgi:hypothetical protein
MSRDPDTTRPASLALDEAIGSSIDGRELFPDGAMFINGEEPYIGRASAIAAGEGRAVVLCFADGSRHVLQPTPPAAAASRAS